MLDLRAEAGDRRGEPGARRVVTAWAFPALVATAYLLLFGESIAGLLRDWAGSGEYGHGFLLLPVALYLAWLGRSPDSRPARTTGAWVLAAAVALFWVSSVASEFFTLRLSALAAVAGLVVYYRGIRQLRAWWLPFALMLFTIPLPEVVLGSLTLPLQLLASRVAVTLLDFRHVPVKLAGNIILLPGHQLFVAEACSGLRSLSAILGLTLLIGGTGLARPRNRLVLLALAIPAALAANAVRVFVTGYLVYFFGPDAAEGLFHTMAGMLVFLVALGSVGVLMLVLRWLETRTGPGAARAAVGERKEPMPGRPPTEAL